MINNIINYAKENKYKNSYYKKDPSKYNELINLLEVAKSGFARSMSCRHNELKQWINEQLPQLTNSVYSMGTKCYWILTDLHDFPKCGNPNCKKHGYQNKNVRLTTGYRKYCSVSCEVLTNNVLKHAIAKRWTNYHKKIPFYISSPAARKSYKDLIFQLLKQMPEIDQIKWLIENRIDTAIIIIQSKRFKYLYNFIIRNTPMLTNDHKLITRIYWLLNKINDWSDPRVSCYVCGKPLSDDSIGFNGYNYKYCSMHCAMHDKELLTKRAISYKKNISQHILTQRMANIKKFGSVTWNCNNININELTPEQKYNRQKSLDKMITTMYNRYKIIYTQRFNKKILYKQKFQFNNYNTNKSSQIYSSLDEDICYNILHFLYPKIIRQYSSVQYPFKCDFYDPDSNTYFEFNGTWTHGKHKFDANNINDINTLQYMQSKNNKYYNNAIETWTQRDIRKYLTAINNKLNYIVFWSLDDVFNYLMSITKR